MKVLVIDDKKRHLQAAVELLSADHDLTTASTYDEAQDLICGKYGKLADGTWGREAGQFDAVLVDLLMPASDCGAGMTREAERLVGQEMPVGMFLASLAAKNGAKYVAVISDSNHHQHPASAMLDAFVDNTGLPLIFQIDSARVFYSNASYLWCDYPVNGEMAKNWRNVLGFLEGTFEFPLGDR